MMSRFILVVAIVFTFLVGCAKSGSDDMKEQMQDMGKEVKGGADHVWKAQVQALDKAKSVGQTLMDAAEEQRRAIDKDSE